MKTKVADWRQSHRSIKSQLAGVVLIPSVALLVLWTVLSGFTIYEGYQTRAIVVGVKDVSLPAVRMLASAQQERTLSTLYLSRPGMDRTALDAQRKRTDEALTAVTDAADQLLESSPPEVRERLAAFSGLARELPAQRARVDSGAVDRYQAAASYNAVLDAGTGLFEAQARAVPDPVVAREGHAATELFRATDRMSRASSIASTAFESGTFTSQDHAAFANLVGTYRLSMRTAAEASSTPIQEKYRQIMASPAAKRLAAYEDQFMAHGGSVAGAAADEESQPRPLPPIDPRDWQATSAEMNHKMAELTIAQGDHASTLGVNVGNQKLGKALIGSILTLLVGIGAILVAARVARVVVRRLNRLRTDVLELSDEQLPRAVNRLRDGEKSRTSAEPAGLNYGGDEIGQVACAFNTAQKTAVAAAVRESQAREGSNKVFLGIAHRSQALVHRQLQLLDKLERTEENPDQADMLFQLDHLATRARRNAENLIILGGERPGRKWSKPIGLTDVLRGAVAETKHYTRVRIKRAPSVSLVGDAVADVLHLIAELVDNATAFSPPRSQVIVRCRASPSGVVVEVEDHGLGMAEEDRAQANAMLSDPPEFDAMALKSDSRLGLFVVAQLAARHGVSVELRLSPAGSGTQAVVLIPTSLTAESREPGPSGDSEEDGEPAELGEPTKMGAPRTTDEPEAAGKAAELGKPGENGESTDDSVTTRIPALRYEWPDLDADQFSWPEEAPDSDSLQPGSVSPLGAKSELFAFWENSANESAEDSNRVHPGEHSPQGKDSSGRKSGGRHRIEEDDGDAAATTHLASVPRSEETEESRPRLPRRRRQANLAPQLRKEMFSAQLEQDDGGTSRSPEQVRDLMSAFQKGTDEARRSEGPEGEL